MDTIQIRSVAPSQGSDPRIVVHRQVSMPQWQPMQEIWWQELAAGTSTRLHTHPHLEVITVLSGIGHCQIAGENIDFDVARLGPAIISVPPGRAHNIHADSDTEIYVVHYDTPVIALDTRGNRLVPSWK